jgi:SAM-dependent methyltransferase
VVTQLQRFYDTTAMGEGWTGNPVLARQRSLLADAGLGKGALRVLDLGCGHGSNTQVLFGSRPEVRVVGMDLSSRAVVQFVRSTCSPAVRATGEGLPFPDAAFDLVVSDDVIEHLVDTDAYVREIKRVLRPGGHLTLSTPNLAAWFNRLALAAGVQPAFSEVSFERVFGRPGDEVVGHLRLFTTKALVEFLEYHGFEVVELVGVPFGALPRALRRVDDALARFPRLAGNAVVLARVP